MKTVINNLKYKLTAFFAMLVAFQMNVSAQDVKAEIKGEDVGSWFSQNWLWVAGVALLLLLILLFSSSSRRSRVTSTTTDRNGGVRRTTTTEEVED